MIDLRHKTIALRLRCKGHHLRICPNHRRKHRHHTDGKHKDMRQMRFFVRRKPQKTYHQIEHRDRDAAQKQSADHTMMSQFPTFIAVFAVLEEYLLVLDPKLGEQLYAIAVV